MTYHNNTIQQRHSVIFRFSYYNTTLKGKRDPKYYYLEAHIVSNNKKYAGEYKMPKKKKRNTKKEFNFVFDRANNMRVARIKRGLSQSQMAKLVKTSQPTYSRIESGVTDNPDPEAMAKISAIFEMEPNRLRGAARIR